MLGLCSREQASQHLWKKIGKTGFLCLCFYGCTVCGPKLGIHSVASDPPVGLSLWSPHANPLMQRLLNFFAGQLPPENGGLSLVLFRKNKVILEKKPNDKWRVLLCNLNAEGHSLPDIIKVHLQYSTCAKVK